MNKILVIMDHYGQLLLIKTTQMAAKIDSFQQNTFRKNSNSKSFSSQRQLQ